MTFADGYHDLPAGKLAMIVTDLEMTTKSPLRQVPLPQGLTFEPLVCNLEQYRDLFRRIGQDWLWFGRLTLTDAALGAVLNDPKIAYWTLTKDGTAEALLELDFRTDGACEIAYFGVTPKLIGTGAGAFLMDRAIEKAFEQDISRLHLHTCTLDSPQALQFYIRSGFTPIGRRLEIDDDPRQTGIYPKTAAPQVPLL